MSGIFKEYDIRGKYPDQLGSATARRIGAGFVRLIEAKRVVIGRDIRPSSHSLAAAFIEGAVSEGAEITDIGMVSTPLLNYAIIDGGFDGGAMVTASHLPAEMNGFKLSRERAIPLSGENGLPELERLIKAPPTVVNRRLSPGYYREVSWLKPYIEKIGSSVENPAPLKVVVDAGNGMAGPEAARLFGMFPVWILVSLYFEPDQRFPHHVPNPALPASTRDLQERVVAEGADLGVAFDEDVDRCGFIDEQGNRVRADLITALFAGYFLSREPGSTVLYDLRSSKIVSENISRLQGKGIRTRVGHAFIRSLMREKNAIFAGEISGHYYYRDMGFTDNGMRTLVTMMNILAREHKPLSELVRPLDAYASTGEINIVVSDFAVVEKSLEARYPDARTDCLDGLTIDFRDWWFNIRHSHTEPLVRLTIETRDKDRIEGKKEEVLGVIRQADPGMKVQE